MKREKKTSILIIESDAETAGKICDLLQGTGYGSLSVEWSGKKIINKMKTDL